VGDNRASRVTPTVTFAKHEFPIDHDGDRPGKHVMLGHGVAHDVIDGSKLFDDGANGGKLSSRRLRIG
jgi:hypothetical protein